MVTPVHTHAHACPVHTHAVLHNAPSKSTVPSFHHETQTQEKAPRCHLRGHLRVHPCTHPTREHRAPSHQHPPGAPNRSATGRCRPSCKHLTHPSHTGCTTKHPTHAWAVLPITQPLLPHLHPPSPLQQNLLVCTEQAHPAHPSQPLYRVGSPHFPSQVDRELSHVWVESAGQGGPMSSCAVLSYS